MSWVLSKKLVADRLPASQQSVATTPEPQFLPCTTTPWGILTVTLLELGGVPLPDDNHSPRLELLLEYEKSCVSLNLVPKWFRAICKFNVTRHSDLTIRIYSKDLKSSERQYGFIGLTTIKLFNGTTILDPQWLPMQDDSSKIRISFKYTPVEKREFELEDALSGWLSDSEDVVLMKEKMSGRYYAEKVIKLSEDVRVSSTAATIDHPFIAPLVSSLRMRDEETLEDELKLYTPYASGGHLFNHLQRVHSFDVNKSRFYIAEIVCALEYLHNIHDIKACLKPANVFLDALGHITICDFGIFTDQNKRRRPEYPARESLIDKEADSKAEDWWTLGIFLYEMLTGLPPFCDETPEAIRCNILEQPVCFSESVDLLAVDLLTRLLNRNPTKRLGAGGAAEVKAHAFFQDIDWEDLLQKKYDPPFRPDEFTERFRHYGVDYPFLPSWMSRSQFSGWKYKRPVSVELKSEDETGLSELVNPPPSSIDKTDDWELLWVEETRDFYFHNRVTKTKQLITCKVDTYSSFEQECVAESTISKVPSANQKKKALETALEAGHLRIISQLLHYGIGMDMTIFVSREQTTPLEWAVKQNNIKLVSMFLAHGTERVTATRALGLAVNKQHTSIVKALLTHGVQCDFEQSDRPQPSDPRSYRGLFGNGSEREAYLPPLVRAIKYGNIEFVRLLLVHGADVNGGYHDLSWTLDDSDLLSWQEGDMLEPIHFSCGRPAQLAMELKHIKIVELLLDGGADVSLTQPCWEMSGHRCKGVQRAVFLRVTFGLRRLSRLASNARSCT